MISDLCRTYSCKLRSALLKYVHNDFLRFVTFYMQICASSHSFHHGVSFLSYRQSHCQPISSYSKKSVVATKRGLVLVCSECQSFYYFKADPCLRICSVEYLTLKKKKKKGSMFDSLINLKSV